MGFWRCFLISRFQASSWQSGSILSPILSDGTKEMTLIVVSSGCPAAWACTAHTGPVFWLHTLCKNLELVRGVDGNPSIQDPRGFQPSPEEDGTWQRSGIFLRWKQGVVGGDEAGEVDMIIFSPTISLQRNLEGLVKRHNWRQTLEDPFCLFVVVLDNLFRQVDAAIAKVHNVLRSVEHVGHPQLFNIRQG